MSIAATGRVCAAAIAFSLCVGAGNAPDALAAKDSEVAKAVDSRPEVPEIDRIPRAWWVATIENLFRGIDLSPPQQAGVDAILEEAAVDRARARKLREVVARARDRELPKREQSAKAELKRLRTRLTPAKRIDAIAELLEPEQREIFDRNRRLRNDQLFKKQRAARLAKKREGGRDRNEREAATPSRAAGEAARSLEN